MTDVKLNTQKNNSIVESMKSNARKAVCERNNREMLVFVKLGT